jgi:hypothetical protein
MRSQEVQIIRELSWRSERELPQKERTKHVHGIHPYLGKFVPQIVDYFLRRQLRSAKHILDPFVGSGTTIVESNIHGINSLGIDISRFNVLLSTVKTDKYDLTILKHEIEDITDKTRLATKHYNKQTLESYFNGEEIAIEQPKSHYLNEWYLPKVLVPLLIFKRLIPEYRYQNVLQVLLSRAARSSRLAPHYELDFPDKPQHTKYYCYKHARICYPTDDSLGFIVRYGKDILQRIAEFQRLRTNAITRAIWGDARTFDYSKYEIDGVITSPPYVGLIDYHEQHKYAYELLGLKGRSEKEIGPKSSGSSKKAIENYKMSVTKVLKKIADECLSDRATVVIIVNDKFDLYEEIMDKAGLGISTRYKRKVDRRTGRRGNGFYEDIIIWSAKHSND